MQRYFKGILPHRANRSRNRFFTGSTREGFGDCKEIRTNDAFFGASDFAGIVKRYQRLGILSFEMECAAVFTVAKLRGLKAGAVLGVVRNIVTEKLKFSIFSSLTL
jgi:uridine phosphorylase